MRVGGLGPVRVVLERQKNILVSSNFILLGVTRFGKI